MPENEGSEGKKSTKTPIVCSEKEELASGSIIAEPLTVNLSFLQITEHASKMQISNNQIINFYQRAR